MRRPLCRESLECELVAIAADKHSNAHGRKVCHELGIRAVWIDRLGETLNPDWTPEAVLPDLVALPDLLETYL